MPYLFFQLIDRSKISKHENAHRSKAPMPDANIFSTVACRRARAGLVQILWNYDGLFSFIAHS